MRAIVHDEHTEIFLSNEEVMEYCKPGEMANTCVWLMMSVNGWECAYYNRGGVNLEGETIEDRWHKGLTCAKRNGCDRVKNFDPSGESGEVIF